MSHQHEGHPGLIRGWAGLVRSLRLYLDHFRLETAPEAGSGRGAPHAGPSPNPRHGGVAPHERQPGLIRGWTATGQAELGRSDFNRASPVSRLPLRLGDRGPACAGPSANPRQGGVAPREGRPGLIWGWTAAGRAELGCSGLIWASSVSRLPLRRGGRWPACVGPSPNPRHGGVAPREGRPGLIRGWTAAWRAELGPPGLI